MRAVAEGAPVAFQVWVFCVGAVLGSFLNVVIARVPRGESVVSPPSRCPRCKSRIAWYDNIPVVSWAILRGRCRHCRLPISPRYPLVELLTALIALAIFRQFGANAVAVGLFAFAAALLALAYIDLDTWLLPHRITWPLLAVGLLSPLWNRAFDFRSSLVGAAVGYGVFAAIALLGEKVLKRETMGWGDVWLLAAIGAWMGWQALLPVVMLSALQGAVVGAILLALGRDPAARAPVEPAPPSADDEWVPPKHAVPYGPFLSLAALEVLLFGDRLFAFWAQVIRRLVP